MCTLLLRGALVPSYLRAPSLNLRLHDIHGLPFCAKISLMVMTEGSLEHLIAGKEPFWPAYPLVPDSGLGLSMRPWAWVH